MYRMKNALSESVIGRVLIQAYLHRELDIGHGLERVNGCAAIGKYRDAQSRSRNPIFDDFKDVYNKSLEWSVIKPAL